MPAIEYEYHKFEFNRKPLHPLSEAEFTAVKQDFDNFLFDHIDRTEEEFKRLKNPHRFRRKTTLLVLGLIVIFAAAGILLEKSGYETAGAVFGVLFVIVLLILPIQGIQMIMSAMNSSSFRVYENQARAYFSFHSTLAEQVNGYADYQNKLTATTESDYAKYLLDEKRGHQFVENEHEFTDSTE